MLKFVLERQGKRLSRGRRVEKGKVNAMRRLILTLTLLTFGFIFSGCDQAIEAISDDDSSSLPAIAAVGGSGFGTDDDSSDDANQPPEDDQTGISDEENGGDDLTGPPVGQNPAIGYGEYEVVRHRVELVVEDHYGSAYFYIPQMEKSGPLPTLVWGHGMTGAYRPNEHYELLMRTASKGYLVIFPNMEIPLLPWEGSILDCVNTYLFAVKKAVTMGLADPENIIFGGYSMGGRVAALAVAAATGLDPFDFWPDPVAGVFEALRDNGDTETTIDPGVQGPQPSDWAKFIDPSVPITVLAAENDWVNPNFSPNTDTPANGAYFFLQLPSDFAQLIILNAGSTRQDRAGHQSFMTSKWDDLDNFDYWGHMKIVAGLIYFHFEGGSREWAYGFMRGYGGLDHEGLPIIHDVYEINDEGDIEFVDEWEEPQSSDFENSQY